MNFSIFSKTNAIKAFIHLVTLVGLFMVLFDNLGYFVDKDKEEFLKIINEKGGCSLHSSGAQKFLGDFFYPLFIGEKGENIPIDKIIFVGTFTKGELLNGHIIREIHSGVLKVKNKNGDVTKGLANYSELLNWTKENRFFKWASWSILAISIFFQVLIFLVWELKEDSIENKQA